MGEDGVVQLGLGLVNILKRQQAQKNIVVTKDENIVCREAARAILKNEFTVHLKVSAPIQLKRLSEGAYRPLLPVENIISFMDQVLVEQDKFCGELATFSLSSDCRQCIQWVSSKKKC